MANTYTQINIQVVFAPLGRENILPKKFRSRIFEYMSGILKNQNYFPLVVNGYSDHVHLFFELNPNNSLSDVVRIIKSNSSKWINDNDFFKGKFSWQGGYGGFSYSKSQRNDVIKYILNQEDHHRKSTFKEEYLKLLNEFEIEFKGNYIFDFYE